VLPDFAKPSACVALKAQAEKILHNFDPDTNRSVFTTNEQSRHADQQFIDSATGIICFFEEEAFDDAGALKQSKELSINKIGHAMHDLDPVFESFTYTPELAAVASDIGMPDALALQTMYICKQPRIGGEVSCHQDATFLYSDPITVTGFWFAIEDATLEKFCGQNGIESTEILQDHCVKHYDMSFANLVNKSRVNYFIELVKSPKYKHYSIDALAIEAGFNSRHHLYKPFKKFHGGTPSDFIHSINN
jgi:AraC-like DNA-binding protein